MACDEGRFHIVFNGEIYNYLELREQLESLGYQFRSDSDTEVLLKAYVQWGTDVFEHLVGMFAFAILDITENSLLLARDFFGIKPLFYRLTEDSLMFASEIKVLVEQLPQNRMVNAQRLYQYLCFGLTDHGDQTMFREIRQLPAAHYLKVDLQTLRSTGPVRYWRIELDRPIDISFEAAADKLREMFMKSVSLHLRSHVPIGAALSGGIDSSAIVMAMRQLGGRQVDLHLFSYVADDKLLSEEPWIDLIAEASGAQVHKVRAGPQEMVEDLDRVTSVQDEPFGSTSICAQNRVFQLARENGVKVMLDGQGADELLAGYRPYQVARLVSLLRRGNLRQAVPFWNRASQQPGSGKWWLAARAAYSLLPGFCQTTLRQQVVRDVGPRWLNRSWFESQGVAMRVDSAPNRGDALRSQLRQTVEELSLPSLLRYEDRNSMAVSIESRVPFLTPQLASFILSLPEHYLISDDGVSKYVFREAMRGIVPDAILDRKDKIGFETPQSHWLTALRPWVETVLSSDAGRQVHALRIPEVNREWNQIVTGRKPWGWTTWRWLNVIEWSRQQQILYS